MKFAQNNVVMQPEILKVHTGGEYTAPITLDAAAFTEGVCKAGNPISADGKKVNDGTAAGILLNDVTQDNPNGTIVCAFGTINTAEANSNAGITIAETVKSALPNIVFA